MVWVEMVMGRNGYGPKWPVTLWYMWFRINSAHNDLGPWPFRPINISTHYHFGPWQSYYWYYLLAEANALNYSQSMLHMCPRSMTFTPSTPWYPKIEWTVNSVVKGAGYYGFKSRTGDTIVSLSWHDWKIIDWDVNLQTNQSNQKWTWAPVVLPLKVNTCIEYFQNWRMLCIVIGY